MHSQYTVGTSKQQTEYSALISGFKKIANTYFAGNDKQTIHLGGSLGIEDVPNTLTDIYIPYKIGCGLGGADWGIVQEIIEKTFDKRDKNVYICHHE